MIAMSQSIFIYNTIETVGEERGGFGGSDVAPMG